MMDEASYVTVNPAVAFNRFNTVVMKWDHTEQEYHVFRISEPMKQAHAESLAKMWAAAMGVEVR